MLALSATCSVVTDTRLTRQSWDTGTGKGGQSERLREVLHTTVHLEQQRASDGCDTSRGRRDWRCRLQQAVHSSDTNTWDYLQSQYVSFRVNTKPELLFRFRHWTPQCSHKGCPNTACLGTCNRLRRCYKHTIHKDNDNKPITFQRSGSASS